MSQHHEPDVDFCCLGHQDVLLSGLNAEDAKYNISTTYGVKFMFEMNNNIKYHWNKLNTGNTISSANHAGIFKETTVVFY